MDSAFPSAPFASFSTAELVRYVGSGIETPIAKRMRDEIARREKVAAGDVSVMTPGERLRHVRKMEVSK
jgi:hypothetical protein